MPRAFDSMLKLLAFRSTKEDMLAWDTNELLLGLASVWVVGLGRAWDWPALPWFARTGAGSLGYVLVLSCILWLVAAPWKIPDWGFRRVLIFVTLTALPGILYAFPAEKIAPGFAVVYNASALAVVSIWRVSLLVFFLRRFAGLTRGETAVASLLPICGIVGGLTFFNLATGVFEIMGGFREPLPNNLEYGVSMALTVLFFYPFWAFLAAFGFITYRRRRGASPRGGFSRRTR